MRETKTIVSATGRKQFTSRHYVKFEAKLYQLGDQAPYFSLTGEERDDHGESGGMMHERLLQVWPELKPLADIHLSEQNGVPMHVVENGWYWAGGDKEWCKGKPGDPPNAQYVANDFRIPLAEATEIVRRVQAGEINKEDFRRFVDAQRDRWQVEATAAIALIKQLNEKEQPMTLQAVVDNYVNGNITDAKAGAKRYSWRSLYWHLVDSGFTMREAKQMADKLKPNTKITN